MSLNPALLTGFLAFFLFPLWLLAGLVDYLCHRRSRIEDTSGMPEVWSHVLQAAQLAVALFIGLFVEITPLSLSIMVLAVLAHSVTAYWDVAYTTPRRYISPIEQHVHSYLEIFPIIAVSIVAMLHWGEVVAPEADLPALRWKDHPLPARYVGMAIMLIAVVQALPLCEELWRSARRRPKSISPAA